MAIANSAYYVCAECRRVLSVANVVGVAMQHFTGEYIYCEAAHRITHIHMCHVLYALATVYVAHVLPPSIHVVAQFINQLRPHVFVLCAAFAAHCPSTIYIASCVTLHFTRVTRHCNRHISTISNDAQFTHVRVASMLMSPCIPVHFSCT